MTTRRKDVFLWRKFIVRAQANDYDVALRAWAGGRLVSIERPQRKRILLEVACHSQIEAHHLEKTFGGRTEELSHDWRKRVPKTKPIVIAGRRLIIPAGAAFGTGEHATTAMSLRMLERLTDKWAPDWSLVDLGTGTGILALAGRILGARHVIGIDNDPIAISTAKENARRNKIDNVSFQLVDVRRWKFRQRVDVVTANLFSQLLLEVLPTLLRSRCLILSGVLRKQEAEIAWPLKQMKFEIVETRRRGKWIALLARSPEI